MLHAATIQNVLIGRLEHGNDLLNELQKICIENSIALGRITAMGAVQKARVAYYNQNTNQYQYITLDQHLEIVSLTGNISLKDGKPIVHVHVVLSDENGQTYGGHLAEETIVFACEVMIDVLQGPLLERIPDRITRLSLWVK